MIVLADFSIFGNSDADEHVTVAVLTGSGLEKSVENFDLGWDRGVVELLLPVFNHFVAME